MTIPAIILLAAAAAFPAEEMGLPSSGWVVGPPKDVDDDASFLTVDTKYCIIKTTTEKEVGEQIGGFIDRLVVDFAKIFPEKFKVEEKLNVLIFAHRREFDRYYIRIDELPRRFPGAVYFPRRRESWVPLDGEGNRKTLSIETLKHELTHHLLHFYTGTEGLPKWFNEGTASFFEYWDFSDTTRRNIAENAERAWASESGRAATVARHFGKATFVPLEKLISLDHQGFSEVDGWLEGLHYGESWALINFLLVDRRGKKFFNAIIRALRNDEDPSKLLTENDLDALRALWYADIEKRLLPLEKKKK